MRIKQLVLENFRSFKDATPINLLSDVNIFIGPNNAGKSNILEALRYINGLVNGNQIRSFQEMTFDRKIDGNPIQLTIKITPSQDERRSMLRELFKHNTHVALSDVENSSFFSEITCVFTIERTGFIEEEVKVSNVTSGDIIVFKTKFEGAKLKGEIIDLNSKCNELTKLENIPQTPIKVIGESPQTWRILTFKLPNGSAESKLVNRIRDFVRKWFWFGPVRQATPEMPPGEETLINSTGANLVKFLNSLQSNDPDEFVRLKNEVLKILPNLKKVLAPIKGGATTVTVKEEGLKSSIELKNLSFGLIQTLILVFGIMAIKRGWVVLIEEPELHLHATSQRRLFELIRNEAKINHKQFFITTHSSIFTGCSADVATYLVTKPQGATVIKRIEEPHELKIIKSELGHRNTDLYGDECVVFIEGDSEEVAFPIIAEAYGYNFAEKGIRLINVRGSGKAKKIDQYLRYLKDSGVMAYVIADGNKEVRKKIEDWKRSGLLGKDCGTVWELEFEDCFNPDMIVKAMNELLKEQGCTFEIAVDELEKAKSEGKSVVKVLEKIIYENNLPSLDKPALSEKLALFLREDIGKSDHKKIPPEKEIEKIIKLVESRFAEKQR